MLPRLEKAAAGGDRDAKRRVALALYDLGRLDEAQTAYERLLADEEDAVLRNRLGNVLRDRGDLSGAEAAYRRALSTDPTLPAPYVNLAELLWRARRGEEALAVLEQGRDAVSKEARPVLEKAMASLRNTAPSGPTTTAPATAPASSPPAQTE